MREYVVLSANHVLVKVNVICSRRFFRALLVRGYMSLRGDWLRLIVQVF